MSAMLCTWMRSIGSRPNRANDVSTCARARAGSALPPPNPATLSFVAQNTRSSAPVTITYLSNLAETHPEGDARLRNLAEFNATNTMKITVEVAEGKAASSETKVKSLAAGGTAPDIFYTAYYFVAEFLAHQNGSGGQ